MTGKAERKAFALAISQQKPILLTITSTTAALRSNGRTVYVFDIPYDLRGTHEPPMGLWLRENFGSIDRFDHNGRRPLAIVFRMMH
jgi:hypothetical protein